MFDDKAQVFRKECARSMSLMDKIYEPKVRRNRSALQASLVACIAVSALQLIAGFLYILKYDPDLESVVGAACILVMIPASLSIFASGALALAISVWGSSTEAMRVSRRDESMTDLERALLSDEEDENGNDDGDSISKRQDGQRIKPSTSPSSCCGRIFLLKLALLVHFIINCAIVVISLIVSCVVISFWHNIVSHSHHHDHWIRSLIFWIVETGSIGFHTLSIWASVKFCWTSQKSVAKRLLITANVFVLGIATSILVMNHEFELYHIKSRQWLNSHDKLRIGTNVCACILIVKAVAGFGTAMMTFSRMGDKFLSSTSMPLPYLCFEYAVYVVTLCFTALNLVFFIYLLMREGPAYDDAVASVGANALVGLLVFIATYLEQRAYSYLLNPNLPSGYAVEEIDLRTTPRDVKKTWASMIDRTMGLDHIGAWDGNGALALMEMYQSNPCDLMTTAVLRVYEQGDSASEDEEENGKVGATMSDNVSPSCDAGATKRPADDHCAGDVEEGGIRYLHDDVDRTTIAIIFVTVVERFDLTQYVKVPYLQGALHWLFGSRSYLPLLTLRFGLVGFQWPFHSGVFLCRKPCRDATTYMTPRTKDRFDDYTDDCNTDVNFSTVAGSMITRMSRVLRAAVEWNDSLRGGSRCTVLMLPSYVTQLEAYAFDSSTFLNTCVGPSSIADLRYYRGLRKEDDQSSDTSTKKKKKKKKRVDPYDIFRRHAISKGQRRPHEKHFAKKGGNISISQNFEDFDKNFDSVMHGLWQQIASKRTGQGEAATLLEAGPKLFAALASMRDESQQFRSVFGLRVNGVPAASAVLFRFPKAGLLTSDIQGLRHDIARPARGYFVMLARAIRLAVENDMRWVDMGPTTSEPKVSAGCRLVECRCGYHTRSIFLRAAMKQGAKKFAESQESDVNSRNEAMMLYDEESFQIGLLEGVPSLRKQYKIAPVSLAQTTQTKWRADEEAERIRKEKRALEKKRWKAKKKAEKKKMKEKKMKMERASKSAGN